MTLRDDAALRSSPVNPAATCGAELMLLRLLPAIEPDKPIDWPSREDWLDAINGFPRITASKLSRLLADRNIRLVDDRITRHRRQDCRCEGDLRAPLAPSA